MVPLMRLGARCHTLKAPVKVTVDYSAKNGPIVGGLDIEQLISTLYARY
jgi:hypothetical protein